MKRDRNLTLIERLGVAVTIAIPAALLLLGFIGAIADSQSGEATKPAAARRRVAIGNWGYGSYGTLVGPDGRRISRLPFQNDPRLTWDAVVSPDAMRPGVTNIWQKPIYSGPIPQTDFAFVRSRFDLATNNKEKDWQYGTYLLLEEQFHPSLRAQWFPKGEGLSTWDIEGSATFAGVTIMHLKPWYIDNYGAWDQAWWDGVKGANKYDDLKALRWSVYYGYNLHKAWNLHMEALVKESAIVGIVGLDGMKPFESWTYPSPMREYIIAEYDLIFTYQYPECVTVPAGVKQGFSGSPRPVSQSVEEVRQLREKYHYKGKIVHILTSVFPDGVGSEDETVQFEEFKAVYPYVDVIIGMPYANVHKNPPAIPYPPRLIKFWETYWP